MQRRTLVEQPRTWLALSILLLLGPISASGDPIVFHSPGDDGEPAVGVPVLAQGGVRSVFLYVDGGPAASEANRACVSGSGDEVCGYALRLVSHGGLTLVGFEGDANANLIVNLRSTELLLNGLDVAVPTAGPKRIGELRIDATAGGWLEIPDGETIGAGLEAQPLSSSTIVYVPEPTQMLMLFGGVVFLGCLDRRRRRSSRGVRAARSYGRRTLGDMTAAK